MILYWNGAVIREKAWESLFGKLFDSFIIEYAGAAVAALFWVGSVIILLSDQSYRSMASILYETYCSECGKQKTSASIIIDNIDSVTESILSMVLFNFVLSIVPNHMFHFRL